MKVLVVEDEPDIAEVLSTALMDEGFGTAVASDGLRALAQLQTFQPDVILTDLMMPLMDGFEFIRRYREDGGCSPIVVMSAFSNYLTEVQSLGVAGFLQKPFELTQLIQTVRDAAEGRSCTSTAIRTTFDESRRLAEILSLKLEEPAPESALHTFVKRVAAYFEVPVCLISITTRTRQHWAASCGLPNAANPDNGSAREDSFCTHAVAARAALVVQDTLKNPFFARNTLIQRMGLRFYAGVPLISRHGETLGTLCLLDYQAHAFRYFDLELLAILARRVLAELEWRERRLKPDEPRSAFRYLQHMDEELGVFSRETFEQALEAMACRALERRKPLSLAVVETRGDLTEAFCASIEQAFPRGFTGRLGLRRLALLSGEDLGASALRTRIAEAIGSAGTAVVSEVEPFPGASKQTLFDLERSLEIAQVPPAGRG